MATIHPTSIVDNSATLADDVEIGPGCVIDGPVSLGPGTHLVGNVYLCAPLEIDAGNTFYPFSCIGFSPQDTKIDPDLDGPGVRIGRGNVFRESVTIHRAIGDAPTTIGDENYLMVNTHVGHDGIVGNKCILANGALVAGHVTLQDRVIMGGNAVVHQFCRLGRLALLSGLRGVVQDMPPFCVVYNSRTVSSLNLVGLRRAGYRRHIKPLQQAFDILYRRGTTNSRAVEIIQDQLADDPLCQEFATFVAGTQRGITPYRNSKNNAVDE